MHVLKWILIVAACAIALLIGVGVSGYLYIVSGPSLELSEQDLDGGSSWPATERAAFVSTCQTKSASIHQDRTPAFCGCVAKEVDTKTSRAQRLMVSAAFGDDWRQMAKVVIGVGMLSIKTDKPFDKDNVLEGIERSCGKLP